MKKRVFTSILIGTVTAIILTAALIVLSISHNIALSTQKRLYEQCRLTAAALISTSDPAKYIDEFGEGSADRLTWIAADGTVLYDNHTDPDTMSNHLERPEVQQALREEMGEADRYSDTLALRTFYAAEKMPDGSFLRLGATSSSVFGVLYSAAPFIGLIIIVVLIAVSFLARWLTFLFIAPVLSLDLKHPLDNKTYPELRPMLERMERQNQRIDAQMTELSYAGRERQEFSANVSHELKTPLTSIMGYAEIMENGIVQTQDIPRFAGKIHNEAKRLLGLIEDIIHLSRLDEGQLQADFAPVELLSLCQDIQKQLEQKAKKLGIALTVEGNGQMVRGVKQTISQMIFNLVDNALVYNKQNGRVTVTVGSEQNAPFVRIADTGIGIAEADQKRVFERFYRVDKSRSKLTGGTGLGLSIVKHAAQLHRAVIRMESILDVGTTITIIFPSLMLK